MKVEDKQLGYQVFNTLQAMGLDHKRKKGLSSWFRGCCMYAVPGAGSRMPVFSNLFSVQKIVWYLVLSFRDNEVHDGKILGKKVRPCLSGPRSVCSVVWQA